MELKFNSTLFVGRSPPLVTLNEETITLLSWSTRYGTALPPSNFEKVTVPESKTLPAMEARISGFEYLSLLFERVMSDICA